MSVLSTYLDHPFWLAPMAGITDRAFRTMCLRYGAGLTCSEMVSAKGLEYNGVKTFALIEPAEEEAALVVQLFGSDPVCMAEQARRVEERLEDKLVAIDVNMGCPVKKVVKRGEGSALMNTPLLAAQIISSINEAIDAPVTAKFRSGWTNDKVTAPEFAKCLEQAGVSLVSVHGRSSRQMYKGQADWDVIAQVKEAVEIPVAGSGDVFSHDDVLRMREQCGVDAVHIARGARGNPWIFTGHVPTNGERVAAMREHYELFKHYAEPTRRSDERPSTSKEPVNVPVDAPEPYLSPLRAQLSWYAHGLPGAATIRRDLSRAKSSADFDRIFSTIDDVATEHRTSARNDDKESRR